MAIELKITMIREMVRVVIWTDKIGGNHKKVFKDIKEGAEFTEMLERMGVKVDAWDEMRKINRRLV